MLRNNNPSFELLFAQLGLAQSPAAIELFIRTHQLAAHQNLHDAPFWNRSQRDFLINLSSMKYFSFLASFGKLAYLDLSNKPL